MRKRALQLITGLGGAAAIVALVPSVAFAQEEADPVVVLGQQVNLLWIIIGAALVIFMQAGFALVETGFCQAKAAAHVVSMNFAVFGLGFISFMLVGYSFAFGSFSYVLPGYDFGYDTATGSPLIGSGDFTFLHWGGFDHLVSGTSPAVFGFFLYMVAFMDTTATIPTGSMAERWKWGSFVLWGLFCGSIFYPLFAGWTWGGGWLQRMWSSWDLGVGYADFAGSGVVHAVGGVAAFAGAKVLGGRIGKYGDDGSVRALPGHHIPMAMLGTFILLFGWFGFNAASTFAATDIQFATVALNTAAAAGIGSITAMFWAILRLGKPDPSMMANGMLAGLVAITGVCAFTSPAWAAVIGLIAGVLVCESILFVDQKLKIDDPVGAISVHGVCGLFGVLAVGIFANGSYGAGWNLAVDDAGNAIPFEGIVKGEFGQFFAQLIGAITIVVVMGGISFAFFKIQDTISKSMGKGGIRSKEEDEIGGIDIPEMGVEAYPSFVKN